MSSWELPLVSSNAAIDYSKAYIEQHQQQFDETGVWGHAEQLIATRPLEQYVVMIPVAAHQEAGTIYQALEQYARQRDCNAFSVVLHMNWPDGANPRAIADSFAELQRAKQAFSDLDIRDTAKQYRADTNIGEIRKDLWDTVLVAGVQGGTASEQQDMYGLNHDIDIDYLPPQTLHHIQEYYTARQSRIQNKLALLAMPLDVAPQLEISGIPMKHTAAREYPNSSRAALWFDSTVYLRGDGFEAGLTIPLSAYARAGGYHPASNTHETSSLLKHLQQTYIPRLASPIASTSSRRLINAFNNGASYLDLWSNGQFSMTESYRAGIDDTQTDMSDERLHQLVATHANWQLDEAIVTGVNNSILADIKGSNRPDVVKHYTHVNLDLDETGASREFMNREIQTRLERRLRMAEVVLKTYVQHPAAREIMAQATERSRYQASRLL